MNVASGVVCNLCSETQFTTQYAYKEFDLMRCQSCGLGVLSPMPSIDSENYYAEEYYRGTLEEGIGFDVLNPDSLAMARQGMQKKIDWLLTKRSLSSFIDIGCGIGLLVEAAATKGIQAKGVDVSRFAIEYGRNKLNIQGLEAGLFQDVMEPGARFDVVYLNHVIEHVIDPSNFVAECGQLLQPGGWLVLEAPDIDSTEAVREGKAWKYILSEHLHYFNISTLCKMTEKHGFKVRYVEKEVDSPGILHAMCGGENTAKEFYDRWLMNPFSQQCIRIVRSVYSHIGQKSKKVDYKYIKVVVEKC